MSEASKKVIHAIAFNIGWIPWLNKNGMNN